MTDSEVEILTMERTRRAIEKNIDRDPLQIALDRKIENAALVATQVKYLQRALKKLPTYYGALAILPPLAFEQSSSEAAAEHKCWSGTESVDLTCGLGVDSLALSRRFEHVTSVECDPVKARVAKINFELMGIDNIDVVCSSAEEYVERCEEVDLIYVDPDRRSAEGRKLVKLEECSPDVTAMLPLLRSKCRRLVVKNSPLFDVDEAFKIFGHNVRVDVVSLGGECKEVLIEVCDDIETPTIKASALGVGGFERPYRREKAVCRTDFRADYKYLIAPDVALRKARLSDDWFAEKQIDWFAEDGYGFCDRLPEKAIGHIFAIERIVPYKPKELRRLKLKTMGVMKQAFPLSTSRICADLGVREGGGTLWAFTRADESLWAIELKKLSLLP